MENLNNSALQKPLALRLAGASMASAHEAISTDQYASRPIGSLQEIFADLGDGDAKVAAALKILDRAMRTRRGMKKAAQAIVTQASGTPYFDLGDYMARTWLRDKREGMQYAARVHKVMRSDHDRALHDHPWHNASIVLEGGYWEVVPGRFQAAIEKHHHGRCASHTVLPADTRKLEAEVLALNAIIQVKTVRGVSAAQLKRLEVLGVHWRGPMAFVPRQASSLHRLIVPKGRAAWSLFIMRPKVCDWGFLGLDGWEHNEVYLKELGREA